MIPLGTIGRVGCLVLSIAIAVLTEGSRTVIGLGVVACCAALTSFRGLRSLADARVAVLLVLLLVPAAFFGGQRDLMVAGVWVSQEGLRLGAQMVVRALTILTAIAAFAASLSIAELSGLFERAGLRGLGFALGVAINMLPSVSRTTSNIYQALRLRGGFIRRRLRAVRLLLAAAVVANLRHAEDVVVAAEARGFAVERSRPLPLVRRPADPVVLAVLAAAGVLLVWF